jgi:hypothetical protein
MNYQNMIDKEGQIQWDICILLICSYSNLLLLLPWKIFIQVYLSNFMMNWSFFPVFFFTKYMLKLEVQFQFIFSFKSCKLSVTLDQKIKFSKFRSWYSRRLVLRYIQILVLWLRIMLQISLIVGSCVLTVHSVPSDTNTAVWTALLQSTANCVVKHPHLHIQSRHTSVVNIISVLHSSPCHCFVLMSPYISGRGIVRAPFNDNILTAEVL